MRKVFTAELGLDGKLPTEKQLNLDKLDRHYRKVIVEELKNDKTIVFTRNEEYYLYVTREISRGKNVTSINAVLSKTKDINDLCNNIISNKTRLSIEEINDIIYNGDIQCV